MSTAIANLLPGVPSVESPFFDAIFDAFGGDDWLKRIANDLREDGFTIFDFPDPKINEIIDRVRERFSSRYAWEDWRSGRIKELRIQDAWKDEEDVRSIASNVTVLGLLEKLYGRKAFPFQTLNFAVGTEQHFHTDSVHFSSVPQRFMAGVWLAMEDIGPDQGPLIYYPGTHKWPIYTNEHLGHAFVDGMHPAGFYPVWEQLVEQQGVQPKTFLAKKGQVAIWAANLLHGGDKQVDRSLTRWSQVTHYFFEGCSYYTPLYSDPFMCSIAYRKPVSILTGEPVMNSYAGLAVPPVFIEASRPDRVMAGLDFTLPEGFSAEAYLELNPDVRAAGVDPGLHYRHHGRMENRAYRVTA